MVVAISGTATLGTSSDPATGVSWLKVGLGILLLWVGLRDWRKRPKAGETPTLPKWLTSVESITPAKAGGLGILLSALNPKNLILLVGGGVSIAQGATTTGDKAVAMIVFIVIAVSTVALPVILNLTMGQRAKSILDAAEQLAEDQQCDSYGRPHAGDRIRSDRKGSRRIQVDPSIPVVLSRGWCLWPLPVTSMARALRSRAIRHVLCAERRLGRRGNLPFLVK